MVRYHEGGRFCEKDEDWDRESALFHLEHAADLGELEAIVALGLMCSQLPHHILADVSLKVRGGRDPAMGEGGARSSSSASCRFAHAPVWGPSTFKLAETGRTGPCHWGTSAR